MPWTQRGMGDADYMYAFRNVVLPIAAEFDPDLILGKCPGKSASLRVAETWQCRPALTPPKATRLGNVM